MKHKINLHQLFVKLDLEDMPLEDSTSPSHQINMKRIRQLTMEKVQKDKKSILPFQRHLFKASLAACIIFCISGVTVFAATNETVRQTISELLGISQTEILTVGKSIESKDYKLTVDEIVCDSYTGIVTISVEALSSNAKETFITDNIIEKLGHLGSVGYGLRELEELQTEYTRCFSFSFNIGNVRHKADGLNFSMEGISKEIKIPITQTLELTELDVNIPTAEGYSVSYQKLCYSELGFTLLGKIENQDFNIENFLILFESMDGSNSEFYQYHAEQDNLINDPSVNTAQTQASSKGIETTVSSPTEESPKDNSIIEFDDKWFSGGGESTDSDKVTSIFSFSKKMDWSTVKSITINGTTIRVN
ncbi:MAG: DUF4179 domain-containing protein [Mobilitalea sp.]